MPYDVKPAYRSGIEVVHVVSEYRGRLLARLGLLRRLQLKAYLVSGGV